MYMQMIDKKLDLKMESEDARKALHSKVDKEYFKKEI